MRRQGMAVAVVAAAVAALATGCTSSSNAPPASFVSGLRVLAIVAEPPEIASGETAAVTAHVVDTEGRAPTVTWSRCLRAPLPGEVVSPACVESATTPDLEALGEGAAITVTMPAVASGELGQPDSTGGVYLPLVARVVAGTSTVVATYRLRLAEAGRPRNANPRIDAVAAVGDAGVQAIDPAAPPVVHSGDHLQLEATLAPGSAETYTVDRGAGPETVTETLTTSWFTTAGELSRTATSVDARVNELSLTTRLPAPPARIDLHAVTRDERGGTNLVQVSLQLQ